MKGGLAIIIKKKLMADKARERPSAFDEDAGDMGSFGDDSGDSSIGPLSAMEEFVSCVRSGDASAALDAFKDLLTQCQEG